MHVIQYFSASWIGAGVDTLSILFDSEVICTSLRKFYSVNKMLCTVFHCISNGVTQSLHSSPGVYNIVLHVKTTFAI